MSSIDGFNVILEEEKNPWKNKHAYESTKKCKNYKSRKREK